MSGLASSGSHSGVENAKFAIGDDHGRLGGVCVDVATFHKNKEPPPLVVALVLPARYAVPPPSLPVLPMLGMKDALWPPFALA